LTQSEFVCGPLSALDCTTDFISKVLERQQEDAKFNNGSYLDYARQSIIHYVDRNNGVYNTNDMYVVPKIQHNINGLSADLFKETKSQGSNIVSAIDNGVIDSEVSNDVYKLQNKNTNLRNPEEIKCLDKEYLTNGHFNKANNRFGPIIFLPEI
jgi:hypothetical protein